MAETDPRFSLVIPCYNEARSLPELIRRCAFVAAEGGGEVILVDNGSSDDSAAVLTAALGPSGPSGRAGSVSWVRVETNQGYGHGIVAGLKSAVAPLIGWTHADLQTDPADLLRALELPAAGHPGKVVIKGKRYARPLADIFFTAGMSVFESLLLLTPLRDINAQPTLFSRELLDSWGTPPDDFSLDLFALYRAKRLGFRVHRFPVLFVSRKWGQSSWNTDFAAKRKFIKRTLRFSFELRRSL